MAQDIYRALLLLSICFQVAVAPNSFPVFPVNGPFQCTNGLTNTECLEHSTTNGQSSTLYWDDPSYPPGCSKRTSALAGKNWQWNARSASTTVCDSTGIENCECKGATYVEMYSHATCAAAGFLPIADAAECVTASAELGRTYGSAFSTTSGNAAYYPLESCMVCRNARPPAEPCELAHHQFLTCALPRRSTTNQARRQDPTTA